MTTNDFEHYIGIALHCSMMAKEQDGRLGPKNMVTVTVKVFLIILSVMHLAILKVYSYTMTNHLNRTLLNIYNIKFEFNIIVCFGSFTEISCTEVNEGSIQHFWNLDI